jgi:hypothetical protein
VVTLGKTKIAFTTADVGGSIEISGARTKFAGKIFTDTNYSGKN